MNFAHFNKQNRFWQRQDSVTFVREMKHEITENDSTSPGWRTSAE